MDSDVSAWTHPILAQLGVEQLEHKLEIHNGPTFDDPKLLDFTCELYEPPD
jgi:hypothetical protein